MEENVEHFENMYKENMYGLGEWATDVEIMGAAAFLQSENTDIGVHDSLEGMAAFPSCWRLT